MGHCKQYEFVPASDDIVKYEFVQARDDNSNMVSMNS